MKTLMIAATGVGSSISKSFIKTLNQKKIKYNIFFFTTKKIKSKTKQIKIITVKKFYSDISKHKKIINKCNYFFHFAYQNSESFAEKNNETDLKVNVIGLKNILECCKIKKKLLFIFFSTVSLYESSRKKVNEKSNLKILSYYNMHKFYCENLINYYSVFSKNQFIILRLSNIYGDTDLKKRDFFLDCCFKIKHNKDITIFNRGKYMRDFLYIKDVSFALLNILNNKINGKLEIYNLCYGKSNSINFLIKKILTTYKKYKIIYTGNIKYLKNNSSLVNRNFLGNSDKFKKKFNWKPMYNLNFGINKVISKIL